MLRSCGFFNTRKLIPATIYVLKVTISYCVKNRSICHMYNNLGFVYSEILFYWNNWNSRQYFLNFSDLFQWNNDTGEWGNCVAYDNKTCGNGSKFREPDECFYNNTEHEEYYEWLCDKKPVFTRNCYKVCNGRPSCCVVKVTADHYCNVLHLVV